MSGKEETPEVRFGGRAMALGGLLAGVAIALILPAITLALGQSLSAGYQLTVIILAVVIGGTVSLVSAFFGLVIPNTVGGQCRRQQGQAPAEPKDAGAEHG